MTWTCNAFPSHLRPAITRVIDRFTKEAINGTRVESNDLLIEYVKHWRKVKLGRSKYWYRDADKSEVPSHLWKTNPVRPDEIYFIDLLEQGSPRGIGVLFTQKQASDVLRAHFEEMVTDGCAFLITAAIGDRPFDSPEEVSDFLGGVGGPSKALLKRQGADPILWAIMTAVRDEWMIEHGKAPEEWKGVPQWFHR